MPDPTPSAFHAGDRVTLLAVPSVLKTADPMPMLRPPSDLSPGDLGTLLARKPGNAWAVRFDRIAYLIGSAYLAPAAQDPSDGESAP